MVFAINPTNFEKFLSKAKDFDEKRLLNTTSPSNSNSTLHSNDHSWNSTHAFNETKHDEWKADHKNDTKHEDWKADHKNDTRPFNETKHEEWKADHKNETWKQEHKNETEKNKKNVSDPKGPTSYGGKKRSFPVQLTERHWES
jgi:hypothetical protein